MADQKITQLTAETVIEDADLVPIVTDVATTPVTKKVTWTLIKSFLKTYFDTLYSGGGLSWSTVTSNTSMVAGHGYFTNSADTLLMTLPATASVGDVVKVSGKGAGGWIILQNASQKINIKSISTTTGILGALCSSSNEDSVELVCVVANTEWNVVSSVGITTVI